MISLDGLIDLEIDGSTWSLKTRPPLSCQILPLTDHFLVIPSDASGGLRGGDSQTVKIKVKNGARVIWQASSASIIYPPASGLSQGEKSHLSCEIDVDDSASLQFRNRTNILCKDSDLVNQTTITVSAEAKLIYQEFFHAGRLGLDEAFAFRSLSSKTSFHCGKDLLYRENWHHRPDQELELSPAGFRGGRAWGTSLWFGPRDPRSFDKDLDWARTRNWQLSFGDITDRLSVVRYLAEFPQDQNSWNPHFEGYQAR